MTYAMTVRTAAPIDQVEQRVRAALKDNGFGILTEIDVQATLKDKLGVDRPPMRILGACNPALANRAIDAEPDVTAFLPCNVTLYEQEGLTVVSAMKPTAVVDLVGNAAVAEVAEEAERLVWEAVRAAVTEPVEEPTGAPT